MVSTETAALADLIGAIGSERFDDAVMGAFHALAAADMCSGFALVDGAPRILFAVSLDPDRSAFARIASLRYAETYWRRDTTALSTLGRAHRNVQTIRRPSAVIRDLDYRHECYAEGAVVERISICRTSGVPIIANAYRDRASGPFAQAQIERLEACAPLIAAAIERHLALPAGAADPVAASLAAETGLSARERQVLTLIAEGAGLEEVSTRLRLAPSSVVTYRRRGYAKLAVRNKAQLRARLRARKTALEPEETT